MARPSDEQQRALAGLLGLGNHSARKSHYPELAARLEDLETERNRYKWLFENAVHGIFQASLQAGMRAANPALARMLGYQDPQEVLFSLADLAGNLFVGGAAELAAIGEQLQNQRSLLGYETQLRRKDGSSIDVLMNLLLKPDQDGLVEGFVADITERKLAQQHLEQLNDQLEQRVAARTDELLDANRNLQQQIARRERIERDLREARDAAEAANRSKDKYLAAASHDLLQPLNAARLLISTLRERSLPAPEQLLVERTHQALEGAEDLLTDLLDISRLDQAAVKPDLATYRLDEMLAPLVSEFQSVAEAAGLGLRVRFGDFALFTDLRLMTRILRNFLSNACRYTERGSILLAARRRGDQLRLEVWDTGRGIAADRLESIFLEFNQLDVGRAADRKGVGLGLAIVERIAKILGYRVQVASRPGHGSRFSIEVPLAARVPLPLSQQAPQPGTGNPLPGRRLLVLDNELSILESMAALLGQWGCEVLTATDQAAALEVLQGRAPELILADFHLDHGVTGCQVVRRLREHFQQPLPAVIITADRSDQCRRALQQLGAPLLNKPVKPGKLRAVLSQLLG
ncbi:MULTISPECIES: PAS domain-containing hybrid sensor histidine kinase/response regulator [Pseudomonas]|uniref:PAS domain-containing hybrid sensor histidine kinase/response regulator n=1 Tax=Pseudomonas TaxID=286 RepID=UPI0008071B69|nr:NahK/ErcS family hybrid sensor histidine kinase/response regulator [Pseudomonas protegens]OBZ26466.1 hybrid sensor histidine kinase/response regulator [Pseudomonas protegens]OBZ29355.1 hybrid sensor histidine kinase/response regulator [Pseudomonas protegens]OKK41999.1 hybrid sensor histidine kinase/response regulator [Pseudomonas protegens]OKK48546.1 hybrid sensor histidine kinase/response regulator [Pseudomonas protegens]OKK53455.1 hybrid sensor histidine kinase/response regulator [Pseudom